MQKSCKRIENFEMEMRRRWARERKGVWVRGGVLLTFQMSYSYKNVASDFSTLPLSS